MYKNDREGRLRFNQLLVEKFKRDMGSLRLTDGLGKFGRLEIKEEKSRNDGSKQNVVLYHRIGTHKTNSALFSNSRRYRISEICKKK